MQALAAQLKANIAANPNNPRSMTLKYLDFSNCFGILSKYLSLLSDLIEIRVGSDAPPHMRLTTKRLHVDDSDQVDDMNMVAAVKDLPTLRELRTLVLKAFRPKFLRPLLEGQVGKRLRRLDLHYNSFPPGINLADVGHACPLLVDLAVCDSIVYWDDSERRCKKRPKMAVDRFGQPLFVNLRSLKLLRVTYSEADVWEAIPKIASKLRILHLESSRGMTDSTLYSVLQTHPLEHLEVKKTIYLETE